VKLDANAKANADAKAKWGMALAAVLTFLVVLGVVALGHYWTSVVRHRTPDVQPPHAKFQRITDQ